MFVEEYERVDSNKSFATELYMYIMYEMQERIIALKPW